MLFSPFALIIFLLWLAAGMAAVKLTPWDTWKIKGKSQEIGAIFALIFGPPILALVLVYSTLAKSRNIIKNTEEKVRIQKLNAITFPENSRGGFKPDAESSPNSSTAGLELKKILLHAISKNSNEIFIDPQPDTSFSIRMRINGSLQKIGVIESQLAPKVINTIKVLGKMEVSERMKPQEGTFSVYNNNAQLSLRVASVGTHAGEKLTIQICDSVDVPDHVSKLKLDADDLSVIQNALSQTGLILLCGPSGSGITTTIYSLLKSMDFSTKNVISIEEPVSTVIPQISQMEVNPISGLGFPVLLGNAIQQNPDVIAISALKDPESAKLAAKAAQTGHLVIAAVPCKTPYEALEYLKNLGLPLNAIASSVRTIICQRLLRTLCPDCQREALLPAEYISYFVSTRLASDNIREAVGCSRCGGTGYIGKQAIFDVMTLDNAMQNMLSAPTASLELFKEQIEAEHGDTLLAYKGFALASRGCTSLDEVNRITMSME